jgi:ACS family tartrate transporter-like MFS transporter
MTPSSDHNPGAATLRKVAGRLIPFLGLLYFFAFLDRVNVGFAALTMNADLGISAAAFGIGSGIFFIGYILCEVPSNVMLERFGARLWIARIMISWGILSAAMAFVQGPKSFYAVRFLLGIAEAGFFPGIIFYLTCWFPSQHRARIIALFMIALPLSSVIGAPISTSLLGIEALGLKGWQWMFLLEAIPTIVLGIAVLAVLPDRPSDATWLNEAEKRWLQSELAREHAGASHDHASSLREALMLPRVWRSGLVYFCILVGLYGFSFWLPQIIASLGEMTNVQVGLVTMIPYSLACIGLVLWGRHSDATEERALHVALPMLLAHPRSS